jgi:hypothetical protein
MLPLSYNCFYLNADRELWRMSAHSSIFVRYLLIFLFKFVNYILSFLMNFGWLIRQGSQNEELVRPLIHAHFKFLGDLGPILQSF